MVFHAVLFDMDGVLVDSYMAWFHLVNQTVASFGHPTIDEAAFRRGWGQGVKEDVDRYMPGANPEEVSKFYDEHFPEHVARTSRDSQATRVLQACRDAGIRTACVTNSPRRVAQEILTRSGLFPLLDSLVGYDEVPRGKPAPDMVVEACRRLDVDPGRSILVGDSQYDMDAGRAGGCTTVGMGLDGDFSIKALSDLLPILDL